MRPAIKAQIRRSFVSTVFIATALTTLVGCLGTQLHNRGKYFRTTLATDAAIDDIRTIGVYVVSDQAFIDASNLYHFGFDSDFFPPEVAPGTVIHPDSLINDESAELASAICEQLRGYGFQASPARDLRTSELVTMDTCLADAANKGYDAAFIVYYRGVRAWTKFDREIHSYHKVGKDKHYTTFYGVVSHVDSGYLYVPNVAFCRTSTRQSIWTYCYYGLVEQAHDFNFASDPFNITVSEALYPLTDSTYKLAAPKAAASIFSPTYWKGSFKKFPTRTAIDSSFGK